MMLNIFRNAFVSFEITQTIILCKCWHLSSFYQKTLKIKTLLIIKSVFLFFLEKNMARANFFDLQNEENFLCTKIRVAAKILLSSITHTFAQKTKSVLFKLIIFTLACNNFGRYCQRDSHEIKMQQSTRPKFKLNFEQKQSLTIPLHRTKTKTRQEKMES